MNQRSTLLLLFVLASPATTHAAGKDYVQVEIARDGATSELLNMPIAASPSLSNAQIGMKYFGPQSESDISVVLTLQGAKSRYSGKETFGARFYAGDMALSNNKFRLVDGIRKQGEKEIVNIHITPEELAWLAADSSAKIEIYNTDTGKKYDTFSFTPTGLAQLKRFAKSVLLIKSHLN